jgi:hypothetical protein
VKGSGGVSVTGSGSAANPYIVSTELNLQAIDTPTVDMTVSGSGSVADPYLLSAVALLSLDDLTDVNTAGATTGQVLARQSDGSYKLVPPATASAGTIAVGNGLSGDGSSGAPLAVKLAPSSGLLLDGTGLKVAGAGVWTAYTPQLTATTTNPSLGNGTATGRYAQIGKLVYFWAQITFGSTTTRGSGSYQVSLPVPQYTPNYNQIVQADIATANSGTEFVSRGRLTGNKVYPLQILSSTSSTDMTWVSSTNPATMPAGAFIRVSGFYEAA